MASQILADVPSVIPLFPLDGTSYVPSQRIQVEIPPSIQVFRPSESYLSLDVTFPTITTVKGAGKDWTDGGDPAVTDSNLSYTNLPQTWGNGGVHGIIRDLAVYSMGTGQEIDRINYYNVACRGMLPFLHGKDESCMVGQEQGLNLWKPDVLWPVSENRLNTQLTEAPHPFDLQYNHATAAAPNYDQINGVVSRTQRYSLPFRFGFMNSQEEFLNLGGLRLDMLLDTAQRSLEFYSSQIPNVAPAQFASIGTTIPAVPFTSLTTTLADNFLLGLANQFPVGSVFECHTNAAPGVKRFAIVTGYSTAGGFVVITHTTVDFLGAGPGTIIFQQPTAFTGMNWNITNVALYVRQSAVGQEAMMNKLQEMQGQENAGYSFSSLYNYPLQIVANQSNPVLNYNIVPLKYAQGLMFIPTCDSDLGNVGAHFPARLSTLLFSGSNNYPTVKPKHIQYQIKLGNDYIPLQPTNIDSLVPQVLSKEVSSFIEVCLAKGMMTAQPLSLDTVSSTCNQSEAGINQLYNRVLACVLVPDQNSAMDISTKNIQLLLYSNSNADGSQYTVYLFAAHYRHLMTSPMGLVVDY